ncbi:MAG: DUF4401 domain-containing protein [Gammaproteobacteria bacterium]|nr:DUF4401 domain-containing protein [Gammaproteobacteria bacterium]
MSRISLQQVVDALDADGLLPEDSVGEAATVLSNLSEVQPWYIRTMVGFGAWLASLLLIAFVSSIGFAADGGFAIIGVGFITGAIFVRRKSENDFVVQSTLACCLAGQAILAYGIVELTDGDEFQSVLSIVLVISVILFFIFPDRVHRVLTVMIATSSFSVLLYLWEFNAIVPVLGPAFATALVVLYGRQGAFIESGKGHLIRPLMTGMMLSAFGFLLLSTVYILPEIDFAAYPRPWISTVLLGALFLYLGTQLWPQLSGESSAGAPLFYGLLAVVVVSAWAVPGLLLAMIVVMLGATSGNRVFIGAGITFLVIFIATYFYGIQVSMLTKSMTLAATGTAVLVARWLILNVFSDSAEGDASHV